MPTLITALYIEDWSFETLSTREVKNSDNEHLEQEKCYLAKVFKSIGYKERDFKGALHKIGRKTQFYNSHLPSNAVK